MKNRGILCKITKLFFRRTHVVSGLHDIVEGKKYFLNKNKMRMEHGAAAAVVIQCCMVLVLFSYGGRRF